MGEDGGEENKMGSLSEQELKLNADLYYLAEMQSEGRERKTYW